MLSLLKARDAADDPIRVALAGAGAMGVGIAWQIGRTPGMRLVEVVDLDLASAERAAQAHGGPWRRASEGPTPPGAVRVGTAPSLLSDVAGPEADVLVEATNTIGFAGRLCEAAIEAEQHVVLMNAEVDLALGPWLAARAAEKGVVLTSDAGDQHGVLARMIDEIALWGFRIVMAGNIKGFLDRHATAAGLLHEARIRNLNPIQCCAYTDGTKLSVEMALLCNGFGLVPHVKGMEGPRATDVREVFDLFDMKRYDERGVVDYVLGAEPGGGVFVVGHCDDPLQTDYLRYYKMGDGPFYLFYRPYHLCHVETTTAIARAALYGEAILRPRMGRVADVYAFAKRDLRAGEEVRHGIGGERFYGMIERSDRAEALGWVPIAWLEPEGERRARLRRGLGADRPLTRAEVELPASWLVERARAAAPAAIPAAPLPVSRR